MQNMDYGRGPFGGGVSTANRMCLKCGQHWYGPIDAIKEYTRAEWDDYVNDVDGPSVHAATSARGQMKLIGFLPHARAWRFN